MEKQDGAFLTIGELATELGVPQHILRYWETRFPALRPLQRAGNRRYYRPEDVDLARAINHLLNAEGYTVRGAQQALSSKGNDLSLPLGDEAGKAAVPLSTKKEEASPKSDRSPDASLLLERLQAIRATLVAALDPVSNF
ncbi:MAG: MerR family transcriptional regulator [Novosphingobium sp.]